MEPVKNKYNQDFFSGKIAEKEKQKLKAQKEKNGTVWFGLGMMGMVGWSVVVPSLLGAALGIWLDKKVPESFSWTLTFLITGLAAGSLIAWHWIAKEDKEIHQKKEDQHE